MKLQTFLSAFIYTYWKGLLSHSWIWEGEGRTVIKVFPHIVKLKSRVGLITSQHFLSRQSPPPLPSTTHSMTKNRSYHLFRPHCTVQYYVYSVNPYCMCTKTSHKLVANFNPQFILKIKLFLFGAAGKQPKSTLLLVLLSPSQFFNVQCLLFS